MHYKDYKVLHLSDCSAHNQPAYPKGHCDCGVGIVGLTTCPNCAESKLAIEESFEPDLEHNPHIVSRQACCQTCELIWWQVFNYTGYEIEEINNLR